MERTRTFGQKLAMGFGVTVALVAMICTVAVYALTMVVASKDDVITRHAQNLIDIKEMGINSSRYVGSVRGFLLTGQEQYESEMRTWGDGFARGLSALRTRVDFETGKRLLDKLDRSDLEYRDAVKRIITMRRNHMPVADILQAFDGDLQTKRHALRNFLDGFVVEQERVLEQAKQAATNRATDAILLVVVFGLATTLLAVVTATLLTRTLSRQIGNSVGQVQSSSTELQAAANQQFAGIKEQATAMNEITTTVTELLATSRQIAESAQRVAQIAERTAVGARSGDATVARGHEAVTTIRRQVDLLVGHMLDLGKKSQQIGTVLDIVVELAEQTNILAINAMIEAAGSGDAGKRFAVVADEIRRLADRVSESTKEIRLLIDDVRGAVNTTVMTTESGSKSVDIGARHFAEVAEAFREIASLVVATTESTREIELSTKQQTTAVEQVKLAISNVAQAARESEASASQTHQTASQLTGLSRDLLRLVQPPRA
jgi:methyl-accepting chemotaxis protein